MKNRIKRINERLRVIGSNFRTDDGRSLVLFVSADDREIKFIRRVFASVNDLEKFVFSVPGRA